MVYIRDLKGSGLCDSNLISYQVTESKYFRLIECGKVSKKHTVTRAISCLVIELLPFEVA